MEVTIIGTGKMARGIAMRALAGDNIVTLLGRGPEGASALAGGLGSDVRAGTIGDPISDNVAVLAVPYTAIDDVLRSYEGRLGGKVVVDITNPVDFGTFTPLNVEAGSAAQEIAGKATGARVVKAFNTVFAGTLTEGSVGGQPLDVLIASDDDQAKSTVTRLVEGGGMRALDAGGLERAHELEALGYLHMSLQESLGGGFASAVKFLT